MKKIALLLPFVVALSACPEWFPTPCERIAVFCEDGTFVVTDPESCEGYCEVGDVAACQSDDDCAENERCITERNAAFAPAMDIDVERRMDGICVTNECPELLGDCNGDLVDSDGDGCVDSCQPYECMIAQVGCLEGEVAVDHDGDGCAESCEPVYCLHHLAECAEGEVGIDIDGDGCDDLCEAVACDDVEILCDEGEELTDANGDGCAETCVPVLCMDEVRCEEDENEVDSDGDGCIDACSLRYCEGEVTECGDGYEPFDSDGDGCADTCESYEQCRAIPTCDGDDREISEESCEEECYSRSLCGVTIYCLGQNPSE